MQLQTENFQKSAASAAQDLDLRRKLRVLDTMTDRRAAAFADLADGDRLRELAREIKREAIENLDRYLLELEKNVEKRGGRVHWARDAAEARKIILGIAKNSGAKTVVKSKSMATEEIGLNEVLEAAGIEAIETDLGEYIVQQSGEAPSHIIVPAIHKSQDDIARLFAEKFDLPVFERAEEIAGFARRKLREKFIRADLGITGANFAVAETGTICLVENEGNIRLSTTVPRVHVALMGIEKVVPKLSDLAVFLKVLARSATGQKMTAYVSLITGAKRADETDGAEEFHLVLLDNGRTRILSQPEKRETLYCLRCGACLNVCPVYTKIGGHAYGSVYPGPIGSILTPPLVGVEKAKDLAFASTLCGACREVCPVKIDIPHQLLNLRRDWAQKNTKAEKRPPLPERLMMKMWSAVFGPPAFYKLAFRLPARFQGLFLRDGKFKKLPFALKGWTRNRDFPPLARKSFREIWREDEKR